MKTNTVSTPSIMLFDQVKDAYCLGIYFFSLPSISLPEGANRVRVITLTGHTTKQ